MIVQLDPLFPAVPFGEAPPLGTARYRRDVDWLDVKPVLGQLDIADPFGSDRASDQLRLDVGDAVHYR